MFIVSRLSFVVYMRHLLLAACFLICNVAAAQRLPEERTWILKSDQLALLNGFTFPTVQFSLEKKISDHFSIAPELGVQLYSFNTYRPDTVFVKPGGYRAGIELRCYDPFGLLLGKKKKSESQNGYYLSLNLFYRQNRYNSSVAYMKSGVTDTIYSDCFWGRKKAMGINLLFGVQKNMGRRLVIDLYGGLGLLSRKIKNFSREYDAVNDEQDLPMDLTIDGVLTSAGLEENSGVIPNLTLGIRLGLRL